ncbi:MAG: DUF2281 domain-containing protein [Methanolinea sp.]|nr:DUF2281 domain-containing protein [Methanolinea sp.]
MEEDRCTHMEGITEKLSRLPPELRKEVEDYVDFLLERHVPQRDQYPLPKAAPADEPPLVSGPLILADEIPFRTRDEVLPVFPDPVPQGRASDQPERVIELPRRQGRSSSGKEKDILDWID